MQAKGVFVAGSAGGGKTTDLRERHTRHNGISVWVERASKDRSEKEGFGKVCRSFTDMVEAVRGCDGEKELRNLRIHYYSPPGPKAVEEPRAFGRAVAQEFDREVSTQVIVDECQHQLPDDEEKSSVEEGNPLAGILHEDRDKNVKAVLATQDPVEVYYPPIKNCKWFIWVGEIKTWHTGFLQAWGFHDLDLPRHDHEAAVIKPSRPPEIVERYETDPSY